MAAKHRRPSTRTKLSPKAPAVAKSAPTVAKPAPTIAPVIASAVAPVLAATVAPVLASAVAPVLAVAVAPVLASAVAPVLTAAVAPVLTPVVPATIAPALSATVAPVLPPTATPLFSPMSIWNQPLAATSSVDPNSAAIVGTLMGFVNSEIAAKTGPWINTTSYSTPVYTVPAGQPTVPVYPDTADPSLASALSAVPIPSDALPAAGSDAEMTVYQPSSDTLWELFGMRQSLRPPAWATAVASTGGGLPAGAYFYAVTALSAQGETTPSPIHGYNVPANGKVTIRWQAPLGSTGSKVYRGPDPQHLQLIQTIAHTTTAFGDPLNTWSDSSSTPTSPIAPPTASTAVTPGQWHAAWGGRILEVSTDPGYYRNIPSPTGGYSEESGWGVTATGLPVAGGLITFADLASGQINHAVALSLPDAAAKIFSFPAQRTDGADSSPSAIPEGARFRLDPSLDLSKLSLPPVTRMLAQAAQRYGLIVNDVTHSVVGFRAQDPAPLMRAGQPNPYLKYFANPASGAYQSPTSFLASFPWSHLQLVSSPAVP